MQSRPAPAWCACVPASSTACGSASRCTRSRCGWRSAMTAAACPRTSPPTCSCRWCPGARRAAGWGWRWRSRSPASIAARWRSVPAAEPPFSSCCCQWQAPTCPEKRMTNSEAASRPGPVWVVDDDRSVRFVLATALRDAGYRVVEFEDAASAWGALKDPSDARDDSIPALLFTDVRMPGDDGLVLLDRLRRRLPEVPVVVMSAYTDVASTAGAFRGGAQEVLSKPFDLDDAVA